MMQLELKNIYKNFGDFNALKNISMSLHSGEIVGFLGPNGSGKSTTLKILASIYQPSAGTIYWQGKSVDTNQLTYKKNIGFLAETNPLYDHMFVCEYLLFVAQVHQIEYAEDKISDYLKKTSLQAEYKKKVGILSKGNRQRLGLIAALLPQPKILLLDEPINGLDPNQIVDLRQLIKKEATNKIILFSSHLLAEVKHLCQRIIIINKGEIVYETGINSSIEESDLADIFKEKTLEV
ncbi:MAG: ABC transporter ATP-binding protein [Sediminibacterium sp.]|nr:ABC transporter ATP-binding protein [Sediminibacterium sp.]